MRLLRSRELDESGEIDSCRFRPRRADVKGLSVPDPIGEGNSNPSRDSEELGSVSNCETDVGVPVMFAKSGEMSPCIELRVRPLLVLAPVCLSEDAVTCPPPELAAIEAVESRGSPPPCCLLVTSFAE